MFTRPLIPIVLVLVLASCHTLHKPKDTIAPTDDPFDATKSPAVVRERFIYTVYEREHMVGTLAPEPLPPPLDPEPPAKPVCPPFALPKHDPIPRLPAINYRRMNDEQVGGILVEYIAKLREYIKDRDEKLHREYKQYSDRCNP